MANIGGIRASIMPIFEWFGPFFILFFLLSVARIIKNNIFKVYEIELNDFITKSENQFL